MNKSGIGIGSASILLVFTVLCLSVFAMISLSTAKTDKTMTDNWEKTVKQYYEADLLAERILAEILKSEKVPEKCFEIELVSETDSRTSATAVAYSVPVSEDKELFVRVSLLDGSCEVLEWRTLDTGEWEASGGLSIWSGD